MLKRISVADLQLGMFVHKLDGSWFDHPFWKARFLVDDARRLASLKESRVQSVVIDTDKGVDIEQEQPAPTQATCEGARFPEASRVHSIKRRATLQVEDLKPVTLEDEVKTAGAIAEHAREQLGRIFNDARRGSALNVRRVQPVVNSILAPVRRNPQAFSALMRCKLQNEHAFRHALSVSALMVALADRMKLSGPDVYDSGLAGLLLDIGGNYLPKTVAP